MHRKIASLGASWGLAFIMACGPLSEDDRPGTSTGRSSSVGSGGSSGSAGSSNSTSVGTSGSSGQGGSASTTGSAGASATTVGSGGSGGSGTGGGGGVAGSSAGGSGGNAGVGGSGGSAVDAGADAKSDASVATTNFSFFVVSMKALQMLSGNNNGFGGNLTFGQANGLAGADEICRRAAEMGMAGAGSKQWRAFLSVNQGPGGMPVHARDRIGQGPWYDRNGRLLAQNLADLFAGPRPKGDPMLINDMTNERGEPNHHVGPGGLIPDMVFDNHDTLTGSDTMGQLRASGIKNTCNDWTSASVQRRP